MKKILDGITVIDLTNVLSGPFSTMHLALLGAEVIKIENPNDGDLGRKSGCVPEYNQRLMGTSFLAQNANKKSLTLNLKDEKGKEIFKKLVEKSDVLVENFRPGVMDRLDLGYDIVSKINAKLIYAAISGYGQTGPDSKKASYDQIAQGLSGVMAINGDETLNPLRAGFPVCDTVGGLNAAFAIMSALYHRERTGEGQFIDIALLDSVMPLMGWVAANLLIGKQQPTLIGNENYSSSPSGVFRVKDGYINIAANKQEQFEDLVDLLDLSHLKEDNRFKLRDIRKQNRFALKALIEEKLINNTGEHWIELFNDKGIPSGLILSLEEALTSEQIKHRKTFSKVHVDGIGEIDIFNLTAKFEKTPGLVESPPPTLSQHTEEILERMGYTIDAIKELRENKVV